MAESIAVLGTGQMGGGLARGFARIGRTVHIGSRDAMRAETLANAIRLEHPGAVTVSGDYRSAARAGTSWSWRSPFGRSQAF